MSSIDQVKVTLDKQYQIEHWIDLTDYDQLPVKSLSDCLEKCKKSEFNEKERIVIVADSSLKQKFRNHPKNILEAVQRMIQNFDIPHFFVIIVSNIESIDRDLEQLRARYNPNEQTAIPYIKYV